MKPMPLNTPIKRDFRSEPDRGEDFFYCALLVLALFGSIVSLAPAFL
jgi:hypothetical protein